MFQFPTFAPHLAVFWVAPFGHLCFFACLAAPHNFSQLSTSFFAHWLQGIHRVPFLTYPILFFKPISYLPSIFLLLPSFRKSLSAFQLIGCFVIYLSHYTLSSFFFIFFIFFLTHWFYMYFFLVFFLYSGLKPAVVFYAFSFFHFFSCNGLKPIVIFFHFSVTFFHFWWVKTHIFFFPLFTLQLLLFFVTLFSLLFLYFGQWTDVHCCHNCCDLILYWFID